MEEKVEDFGLLQSMEMRLFDIMTLKKVLIFQLSQYGEELMNMILNKTNYNGL